MKQINGSDSIDLTISWRIERVWPFWFDTQKQTGKQLVSEHNFLEY